MVRPFCVSFSLLADMKRLSSQTSPQTGVAIPIKFALSIPKSKEIATPV